MENERIKIGLEKLGRSRRSSSNDDSSEKGKVLVGEVETLRKEKKPVIQEIDKLK